MNAPLPPDASPRAATRRVPGGRVPVPAAAPPGSRRVRGLVVADRVDPRCARLLQSYPVLLTERVSGENGAAVRRQVVDGLYDAARELAEQGIDVRPLLDQLGKNVLRRRLETDAVRLVTKDTEDGRPLRHDFLVVDDFADQGLVLALATGSGTRVDVNLHGPAVDWLAGQVLAWSPAVVFAREWERWGRDPWAFATLASALKRLQTLLGQPAFGGDRFENVQELDERFEERLFVAGRRGKREVVQLRARAAGGSRQKTGTRMEHGRVPYATHVPAPPGMATARVQPGAFGEADEAAGRPALLGDRSGTAASYLYIDTPSCRPDPDLVIKGSGPVAPHGANAPADQAAMVRWFLAHFGLTGPDREWGLRDCAAHLAAHGYATDGLRRHHSRPYPLWRLDGDTAAESRHRAQVLCNSMLRNLEHYRTGVFDFALAAESGGRVTITDVFPPEGAWLTEADHARILAYLAGRAPVRRRGARSFTGLPVPLDGMPTRLEASNRGKLRYYLARPDRTRAGTRERPVPPLPHPALIRMVVSALMTAGELPRLPADERDGTPALRLEAERHAATLAQLRATNDRRLANLGTGALDERALVDLNKKYNETSDKITQAEARLAQARHVLEQAEHPPLAGIAESDLIPLVAALADPWSERARALVHEGLRLQAWTERVSEAGRPPAVRLRVRGDLLVHNAGGTWRVPVSGEHENSAAARVQPRIERAVDGLRVGRPLWDSLGSEWPRWAPLVRDALGLAGSPFRFARVDDARLLRLCMAVLLPPTADPGPDPARPRLAGPPRARVALDALAQAAGEPPALLHRILAVHTEESTPHPRWRHDNSTAIAQAFAVAASAGAAGAVALPFSQNAPWFADGPFAAEWSFAQAASRLQECANCRGTSRVPLRLRESTGSVCAHCRTDRAGVPWPAEYDRYRHRAH